MDPKLQSSPPDTEDAKVTFRKPSNDVASRKYRRRSPDVKASGDHESLRNDRSSSPIYIRGEPGKDSEHRESRKDEGRRYDRDQRVQSGDSDPHSSKNPNSYSRPDDYSRREKYLDEDRHNKASYLQRDSRGTSRSDRTKQENDNGRSRDSRRHSDKYSRDRDGQRSKDKESYPVSDRKQTISTSWDKDGDHHRRVRDNRDGERGYGRSSEYRSERTDYRDRSRVHVKESLFSRRDDDKYHTRDIERGDPEEYDDRREKKKHSDIDTNRDKDAYSRASGEQNEEKSVCKAESQQSKAKRTKLFSSEKAVHPNGDGENQSSSPKQVPAAGNVAMGTISEATNDLNAAKVAAMKAAELVNKNLVGGSLMSTEQKKKLLWGNKKSTTTSVEVKAYQSYALIVYSAFCKSFPPFAYFLVFSSNPCYSHQPSGHRWDTSMFGDRERQEKFNKLMSLSQQWYLWPIVGCEGGREGGIPDQQEQQPRGSPSRKTGAAPDGVGEAVHSWTSSTRWTHGWIGTLMSRPVALPRTRAEALLLGMLALCSFSLYPCLRTRKNIERCSESIEMCNLTVPLFDDLSELYRPSILPSSIL
ncbi:unnamed protein product [Linum tenue]|uniref:Arginine/serine-rich coiled-coil protein 2 n=1 Tax=Linum tenue TaxID=586396 RepID=A0AAV0GNW6_9ROSI|nr:unnamed protein product [Linum tenue]